MQRLERICKFHRLRDFSIRNQFVSFWCGNTYFRATLLWYDAQKHTAEATGRIVAPVQFAGHEVHIDLTSNFSDGFFTFMSNAELGSGEICMLIAVHPKKKVDWLRGHIQQVTHNVFRAVSQRRSILLTRGYDCPWGPHLYRGTLIGLGTASLYV